jgi:DNA-directed RNA polymerase specialized sigma24 family protein
VDDLLTQTGFDKLLALLDADRGRAGARYEALRARLIKLFEWRDCEMPEELADEVFDRVTKKIEAGELIRNVEAYSATVAQFVLKEDARSPSRRFQSIEDNPRLENQLAVGGADAPDETDEVRLACLDRCLAELSGEQRRLITAYYDTDERTMIEARRRLAAAEGISPNSLRIRVCRLKARLEECAKDCCSKAGGSASRS